MAQKYTILKVLTRTSNKGFTLLELLVGMIMTLIIGGLAMSAFVNASKTFSQDKKSIDSNQNLSAVLQIIGDDIKQSGEQIINDNRFPVIEIGPNNDTGNMPGSSKITIRRALTTSLALCEPINNASGNTTLIVADDSVTNPTSPCKIRTPLSTTTNPSTITRTTELRAARNYRCTLDNPSNVADTDFCEPVKANPDKETVLAAMSDSNGNIRTFRYLDDVETTPNIQYTLNIDSLSPSKPIPIATYNIGDPIYLIEERTYTLDNKGKLKLEIDANGSPQTLISGIQAFNISARLYSDATTKEVKTSPSNTCVDPSTNYACVFDNSTNDYNWKNIAGVKVELQAKYDSTGKNAQPVGQELIDINKKLTAAAEFFPRNVMSR
jgi:type II secretory pathway pseudopilin PulG